MVQKLTIDNLTVWKAARSLAPANRVKMAQDPRGNHWLSLLTPAQYAELFPSYYKKQLPDIGKSVSGGVPMSGDGGSSYSSASRLSTSAGPRGSPSSGKTYSSGSSGTKEKPDNRPAWQKNMEKAYNEKVAQQAGVSGVRLKGGATAPNDPKILEALNKVGTARGINPAAIAGLIKTESNWDTRGTTGSYNGLTQIGGVTMREAGWGIGPQEFKQLSAEQQIEYYGKWLDHYKITDKIKSAGIDMTKLPVEQQAAILQGLQFSPNVTGFLHEFAKGNPNAPATNTRQARALGSTSIADMSSYYKRVYSNSAPEYESDGAPGIAENRALKVVDRTGEFPNYGSKNTSKPYEYIGVHYTAGSTLEGAISTAHQRGVGYQYLIDKDGTIHKVQDPEKGRSWHWGENNIHPKAGNENSLGVAFVGRGNNDITEAQRKAGLMFVEQQRQQLGIPPENVLGHGEVTVNHREDDEGYGLLEPFRKMHGLTPETGKMPDIASEGGVKAWKKGNYDHNYTLESLGIDSERPAPTSSKEVGDPSQTNQIMPEPSLRPSADPALNPELKKYMDALPNTTEGQAEKRSLQQQIDTLGVSNVNRIFEQAGGNEVQSDGVNRVLQNQSKVAETRKGALSDTLVDQLNYAAEQSNVKVEVTSGGQRMEGAPGAVGSHRHDHGSAADFRLFREDENGKKTYLNMSNPDDKAVMEKFVIDSVKAGATGVGAGHGYMGSELMHVGGGRATHWGGADFIGPAWQQGMEAQKEFGSEGLQKWKEEQNLKLQEQQQKQEAVTYTPERTGPTPLSERGMSFGHPLSKPQPASDGATGGTGESTGQIILERDGAAPLTVDTGPSATPSPSVSPAMPEPSLRPSSPPPAAPAPEAKPAPAPQSQAPTPPPAPQASVSQPKNPELSADMSSHRTATASHDRAMKRATLGGQEHFNPSPAHDHA